MLSWLTSPVLVAILSENPELLIASKNASSVAPNKLNRVGFPLQHHGTAPSSAGTLRPIKTPKQIEQCGNHRAAGGPEPNMSKNVEIGK